MHLSKEVFYVYMGIIIPASIVIPIIPAILKYRRLSPELKIITWYLFFAAVASIINSLLGLNNINNMPVMHIYTLIEFILLSVFYRKILDSTRTGKYVYALIPVFIILCIVNVFFFQNIHTYNTYTKSIEAVIIIFFAVAYFKKILDKIGPDESRSNLIVYLNSGLLLYFSGSFALFTISNLIVENRPFFLVMWSIHATFLLLLYILIAIALWKHKK